MAILLSVTVVIYFSADTLTQGIPGPAIIPGASPEEKTKFANELERRIGYPDHAGVPRGRDMIPWDLRQTLEAGVAATVATVTAATSTLGAIFEPTVGAIVGDTTGRTSIEMARERARVLGTTAESGETIRLVTDGADVDGRQAVDASAEIVSFLEVGHAEHQLAGAKAEQASSTTMASDVQPRKKTDEENHEDDATIHLQRSAGQEQSTEQTKASSTPSSSPTSSDPAEGFSHYTAAEHYLHQQYLKVLETLDRLAKHTGDVTSIIKRGYAETFGTFMFSFVMHGTVISQYQNLKPSGKSVLTASKVLDSAAVFVVLVYLIFAVVAYMAYAIPEITQADKGSLIKDAWNSGNILNVVNAVGRACVFFGGMI